MAQIRNELFESEADDRSKEIKMKRNMQNANKHAIF